LPEKIDAKNQRTAYMYDDAGNLVSKIDAKSQKTGYFYDAAGRLMDIMYFNPGDPVNPVLSNQPKSETIPYLLPHLFTNPNSLNLYSYVSSNPTAWIDPHGVKILNSRCLNKPDPWPPESCPPPEWFDYNSHYCCEQRCWVFWKLNKWYHWISPVGLSIGVGNYMGCFVICNFNHMASLK